MPPPFMSASMVAATQRVLVELTNDVSNPRRFEYHFSVPYQPPTTDTLRATKCSRGTKTVRGKNYHRAPHVRTFTMKFHNEGQGTAGVLHVRSLFVMRKFYLATLKQQRSWATRQRRSIQGQMNLVLMMPTNRQPSCAEATLASYNPFQKIWHRFPRKQYT